MVGRLALVVGMLPLAGCASLFVPGTNLAERNRGAIERLEPGISQAELTRALGDGERRVKELPDERRVPVSNPHRELRVDDPQRGETRILYYYTRQVAADGYVGEDELTPLVVRDGRYLGAGSAVVEREVDPEALDEAVAESIFAEMQSEREPGGPVMDEHLEQAYREALGRARFLIYLGTLNSGYGF